MNFKVKDMDIATGGVPVAILNQKDAQLLDVRHLDRVLISKGKKKVIAVLNIAESKKAVAQGRIGLFEEVLDAINAKQGSTITFSLAPKPASLTLVRKKLAGQCLTYHEYKTIMDDISHDRLTDIELTAFVVSNIDLNMNETAALTRAMKDVGDTLNLRSGRKKVVDLHSIGGVPGNRVTITAVPILVAAGLTVPKTSTRAITSPAGTADTMEVLCNVSLPLHKLKKIAKKVGGFMTWGGAINLSPADDKIIKVERPLSIDAEGQMLASIMSKKASVNPTHLYIEIPTGTGAKVHTQAHAKKLQKKFEILGDFLRIKTKVVINDGSQPIGNGIGPVLEMKDCLHVLMNNSKAPHDLREKTLRFAGDILEFTGTADRKKGYDKAKELLVTGQALAAFENIVKAQEGRLKDPKELRLGKHKHVIRTKRTGRVRHIDNHTIAHVARIAGAPQDQEAGLYLHVRRNVKVKKGDVLITIYADNNTKLAFAIAAWKEHCGIEIR